MDEYATHLPILKKLRPKRVLEYGPGLYSTGLFLSRKGLKELVSVETDPEWAERLQEKFSDERWILTCFPRPNRGFDLIFIDDGTTAEERVKTITRVLSRPHPRVVIHDAEVSAYREAIGDRPYTIFKDLTPHTAVVCASS